MKLAGIDYSTPDRHGGRADADAAPGDLPWWNHYDLPAVVIIERTREVAQVLPARRSLPGTTCTAWGAEDASGYGGSAAPLVRVQGATSSPAA